MPLRPNKKPTAKDFLKRRTFEQGQAMADAAHSAAQKLYCDALGFWRNCAKAPCKRHRQCKGAPAACLLRGWAQVPPERRREAEKEVIAGGPRRIPPATHFEWLARRSELAGLESCGLG